MNWKEDDAYTNTNCKEYRKRLLKLLWHAQRNLHPIVKRPSAINRKRDTKKTTFTSSEDLHHTAEELCAIKTWKVEKKRN